MLTVDTSFQETFAATSDSQILGTQDTIGAEEFIDDLSEGLSDLMSPVKQTPRGVKAGVKRGPYRKQKALDDPSIDPETLRRRLSEPKKFLMEFCQGLSTYDVHFERRD